MKAADFLDVASFPEITFVTTNVEATWDTTAHVTGNLTIKSVTSEETFMATVNNIGPNPFNPSVQIAGFKLKGDVDRTDYGITFAAPGVGAVLQVTINAEITN